MNALVLAIIKMLQTLKAVVKANEAKFTVIPAFSDTFKEVTDLLTEMEQLQLVAVETTNSTTETVLKLKDGLAKATLLVCRPMKSLANKGKDTVLLKLVSVNYSTLTKKSSTYVIPVTQNIFDKTTELKGQAKNYGLTEVKLQKMGDLLAAYKLQSPEVGKLKGEINTSKRDIDSLQEEALEILRGQLDPMVDSLQDTDATAVKLWKAARHVNKPQSTPTQLLAMVSTQDGEALVPVADAVFLAINGKKHVATTNEKGEAELNPLPFGIYDYQCEVPGYQPFLLKQQKVVRGRVNKVAVVLKKAA